MLKLRAGNLILIGLSDRELGMLTQRKPLPFNGEDLELPGVRFALFHAADEAALVDRVREFGFPIKTLEQSDLKAQKRLSMGLMTTASDIDRAMHRISGQFLGKEAREPPLEPIDPSPCPHCGRIGTDATAHRGPPKPGDWALCTGCAGALVLDDHLRLRKPSEADWAALGSERRAELDEVQSALRSAMLARPNTETPDA